MAAAKSVSENVYAHSLHCYFVRAGKVNPTFKIRFTYVCVIVDLFSIPFVQGDPSVPVLYQVERTRDGRSFCVRSVKAIQHGQPILICQASFHMLQPSPLEHQFIMPTVPTPDSLLTIEELIQRYLRCHSTDVFIRQVFLSQVNHGFLCVLQ